ncbi:carbohydrate binding family 9 domain-containing protein [bacterium]|nr:carbohydrate binding family 9 domain-containing protein [bacterium]
MFCSFRYVGFVVLLIASAAVAVADAPSQVTLNAVKVEDAPKIDGALDDKCWIDAPECTGFYDSRDRTICIRQTIAKICYDENNIYVAFHALHPHPDQIRAEEKKRNGDGYDNDDYVGIDIDSKHQHRYISWFDVNPIGTQAESLECSSTTNIAFKGDWLGAAKIVDDGYTVEMAIPFALLPYDKKQDTFGISFVRNIPEEDAWSEWPDLNGRSDKAFYAHWQKIELPRFEQKPKILGYMLNASGNDQTGGTSQGLDIKYPFSTSSMAIASINPDFNSIEQDVESIDFSYEEKYLSDSRPFFQEWPLEINSRVFYSRRITDFDTGIKFVGTDGPNGYGVLSTRASGEDCTLASVRRHFGNRSGFKINVADHNATGHRNTVTYFNPWYGWLIGQRSYGISAALLQSSTTGMSNGRLASVHCDTWAEDGKIGGYFEIVRADSAFNSELGYSPDSGRHGMSGEIYREKHYQSSDLNCIATWIDASTSDYNTGELYERNLSAHTWLGYLDGRNVETGILWQKHEQYSATLPYVYLSWNTNKINRDGETGATWGHQAGGKYLLTWIDQKVRISKKTTVGLHAEREYIGYPSPYADTGRQVWVTLNYDLTNERSVGGRVVRQDGDSNVFFMYRQQVREGSDIYFIYGDPNADDTQNKMTFKVVRSL